MASAAAPIISNKAPAPPLRTLTDELLEEIFLRLPTPEALAHATTACPSFRCIITDRWFLRRFRALHPPPLLGFVAYGFHAAETPHPSAPLARALALALALAADFSYSFVPAGRWLAPWHPRDVRQGRVLLDCLPEEPLHQDLYDTIGFPGNLELAVCDPLYRRYVLLPPMPDELKSQYKGLTDFEIFLAPTREDEEETSFRVICTASRRTGLAAFVFSSVTGQWHMAASPSWSSLGIVTPLYANDFSWFQYAGGCFYWMVSLMQNLLVLNVLRMEFSAVNFVLPRHVMPRDVTTGPESCEPRIILDREGNPELLIFGDYIGDGVAGLFSITKQNDGEPSDKWQLENIVPLPLTGCRTMYVAFSVAEGFLFLRGLPVYRKTGCSSDECLDIGYFLLDVKTSELKKVCKTGQHLFCGHSYFGFPPSLSTPCL